MSKLLRLTDIDQFVKAGRIPEGAITAEIQENVKQLYEDSQIETWLRELLHVSDHTPHGPTEIADILTTKVKVNGTPRCAAFVNKGKGTRKVNSKAVANQFFKLHQVPGLQVVVFLAVGDIQDDAKRDFMQTANDLGTCYLIIDRIDVARLFIAAGFICPKDGLPFGDDKCPQGHDRPNRIDLHYQVTEGLEFEILSLEDTSHAMAKRLSATVLADRHYPQDTFRQIVSAAIQKVREDSFVRSDLVRKRFGDSPPDVIWVYVGADMFDASNCNWICRACWISSSLPANFRPLWDDTDDIVDGAMIVWNSNYQSTKVLLTNASGNKGDVVHHVEEYLKKTIELLDIVESEYRRFSDGYITEAEMNLFMKQHHDRAESIYMDRGDGPIPPPECKDYEQRFQSIIAHFSNLWHAYGHPNDRTADNRRWLFEFSCEKIAEESQKLQFEREKIGLTN